MDDTSVRTLTVSQLNRRVKDLLEVHFPLVWVEGEISNISKPASGHWYFTLKDARAQISCAMFRGRNALVKFAPKAGDHLKVRARVSLYEGRGDFQLIVEFMEPAGFGLLQKRFEELKTKLESERLFDTSTKKSIPKIVKNLAVVTSPQGAAIRDVLAVLERRFPSLPVTIIPSVVQGDDAPTSLVKALRVADTCQRYDLILICRGGGSIEDLWAFNSESLARAIHACSTPILCAVGHEVDVTIADFVADMRAPTPSAAAELLSPDRKEISDRITQYRRQLDHLLQTYIAQHRRSLTFLQKRLKHPRERIEHWYQQLDRLELQMQRAMQYCLQDRQNRVTSLHRHLRQGSPQRRIDAHVDRVNDLHQRLARQVRVVLAQNQKRYQHSVSALDIVSPLATIQRGYSIARNARDNIVRRVDDVELDERITVLVSDGEITAQVQQKKARND